MGEGTCTVCDCPLGDVAVRIDIGGKPVGVCCSQALNETSVAALPEG
jgi:hypothetical protein